MRFTTLAAVFTTPFLVSAAPTKFRPRQDINGIVVAFAEMLERLESQFYKEALAKFSEKDITDAGFTLPAIPLENFKTIQADEDAHQQFLVAALDALGAQPFSDCTFNFDSVLTDVATVAAVARVVETVGISAYSGAAPLVTDSNVLVAAAGILTIEARHQAILNLMNGAGPMPQPFDMGLTPSEVLALAGGFIQGCTLPIPSNLALQITNKGPIAAGTTLTFNQEAIDAGKGADLSCQMITGNGNATAISMPLDQCIVPGDINGPVYVFLTNDLQPLPVNSAVRKGDSTVAGPTLFFIDPVADPLGALIRNTGAPVNSSEPLTPDQAQSELAKASGSTSAPGATDTAPPAATATSSGTATDIAVSDTASAPASTDSAATPAQDNVPATALPAPPIKVIGLSTIPAPGKA